MSAVFVGDVGTQIVLDCGVDISTSTVRKIEAKKPSGVKVLWTATLDGTQRISYTLQAGDLDAAGGWVLQAYIEMPGWSGRGEMARLDVRNVA